MDNTRRESVRQGPAHNPKIVSCVGHFSVPAFVAETFCVAIEETAGPRKGIKVQATTYIAEDKARFMGNS
jgi:hypothetical protein